MPDAVVFPENVSQISKNAFGMAPCARSTPDTIRPAFGGGHATGRAAGP